jgi:hypothetical protein
MFKLKKEVDDVERPTFNKYQSKNFALGSTKHFIILQKFSWGPALNCENRNEKTPNQTNISHTCAIFAFPHQFKTIFHYNQKKNQTPNYISWEIQPKVSNRHNNQQIVSVLCRIKYITFIYVH